MPPKSLSCPWLIAGLWLYPVLLRGAAEPDPPTPVPTRDEIFLAVFHHLPPAIPVNSYVLVAVDGSAPQKVKAVLVPDGSEVLLEGRTMLVLLGQWLRPEIVQRLEQQIDRQGWLHRTALTGAGLATAFDQRKFEFSIETAPGMRGPQVQYLNVPQTDPFSVPALRPAPVSGFLNFNLKGTAKSLTAGPATDHETGVSFAADGAVNVRGVVLEGSVFGETDGGRSLQRGDVRLVYDRPQRALRFTAGDLIYPVTGYQTMVPMGGIGLARDFSLQPHVPTYRTSEFDFYLERPAEVKVWVNESLVSTLQLPAGAHDIRGLLPTIGQNDINLVIEDGAGRRQVLHFAFIYNPTLLDQGRRVFSYNAGFRREVRDGVYRYDLQEPVFSASYFSGLTAETTLGTYAQSGLSRALLGLEALHTTAYGTWQLDTATSRDRAAGWDAGARLSLTTTPIGPGIQSQLVVEYLGKNFGSIETTAPASGNAMNYLASLSVPLGRGLSGHLSGNYLSARRTGATDAYGVSATLHKQWNRYTSGSVSLRHHRSDQEVRQTELLFGLTIIFSRGAASFYAAKELESHTVTTSWDSGRPSNATTPYGFASARLGTDTREYRGGGGYWGSQGIVEAAYARTETGQGPALSTRDEATLRLQSALVFADTTFALARSVTENFAIVSGQAGLAQVDLKVDPDSRGGSRARTSWLSPAVLGNLASYRLRNVRVEPVNPPLGATPDKTTFLLAPTYKSGILLKLGKEAAVVALGRLVGDQGEPLAYLPIKIQRLGHPEEPPVSTFTSRGGGFQMSDLKPGRYEIQPVSSPRWGRITVLVPETTDGLCRLGDVVLPPGP